jgi:Rrf2 family protein
MMVEMAKKLKEEKLVKLRIIAQITGLSEKYLGQLAIPLKAAGLIIGVPGKHGGYHFSRPAERIRISEIIGAVLGRTDLVECVGSPDICLNSTSCESRMFWVVLSGHMMDIMNRYTLADLAVKENLEKLRADYADLPLLYPDKIMAEAESDVVPGCPVNATNENIN